MDIMQIQKGLQKHEKEAFRAFVRTYGKPVYERLLEQSGDPVIAKEALKTAIVELYTTISTTDARDPIDAILFRRAEQAQKELRSSMCLKFLDDVISETTIDKKSANPDPVKTQKDRQADKPAVHAKVEMPQVGKDLKKRKERRAGRVVAAIFLSMGILLLLWIAVGLLIDMDLIPTVDLGYEWFNQNIALWF